MEESSKRLTKIEATLREMETRLTRLETQPWIPWEWEMRAWFIGLIFLNIILEVVFR